MPANRIFYASQAVGFRHNQGSGNFMRIHGLQSVGINTNFNLDAAYQLGNLDLYANIEGTPEVEVSLQKLMDGRPTILDMATATGAVNAATNLVGQTNKTLVARASARTDMLLSVHDDDIGFVDDTGRVPLAQCLVSGAYLSQTAFDFPLDGQATESATLVGNTKIWSTGSVYTLTPVRSDPAFTIGNIASGVVATGVVRRQHVDVTGSTWPVGIPGVNSSGKVTADSVSGFLVHYQKVNVACQLGRESLMELGRKMPYFRFVKFPVEVTSSFEIQFGGAANKNGDFNNATENGADGSGNNLRYETIIIKVKDGTQIDLGVKNMLTSVSYQGGGVDGSNGGATYSFRNFNNMTVSGASTTV